MDGLMDFGHDYEDNFNESLNALKGTIENGQSKNASVCSSFQLILKLVSQTHHEAHLFRPNLNTIIPGLICIFFIMYPSMRTGSLYP